MKIHTLGRLCLLCLSLASALHAQAPLRNPKISGDAAGVVSGTFTVQSGAELALAPGALFTAADPISLANGGTGAALADPGADRVLFWDDSAGAVAWLQLGSGLSISGTTLSATSGFANPMTTAGDLIVGGASGAATRLGVGTAGQVLTVVSGAPAWAAAAGGGGGGGAPTDATYITQTPSAGLSAEQALSELGTGLLRNTTGTGVLSIGAAGTDFVAPGAITTSGLTMATARLLGRTTASAGAVEEITVGTGLSLSGGTLSASAAGANTQIQFNGGGAPAASSALTFGSSQFRVGINGSVVDSLVNAPAYVANANSSSSGHATLTLDRGASTATAAFNFATAGSGRWEVGMTGDSDFMVRDYVNNHKAFRIDTNRITFVAKTGTAITTASTSETLVVQNSAASATNSNVLNISGPAGVAGWWMGDTSVSFGGGLEYNNAADSLAIYANGASRLTISSGGVVNVIATTASTSPTSGALTVGGGLGVAGRTSTASVNVGGTNGTTADLLASASATLDFPSITASGGTQDMTITVSGAATGDVVMLGLPATPSAGVVFNAWVSAANTVTVRATNTTAGALDPASASYRVAVLSF